MTDFAIWKPEHDGHAPPNWREGMKCGAVFYKQVTPGWSRVVEYFVPAEALNSPNDDAGGDIPAFPTHGQAECDDPRNQILSGGMTLRDYFAAAALPVAWSARDKGYYEGDDADMAACAYQIADAMIAERSKRDA